MRAWGAWRALTLALGVVLGLAAACGGGDDEGGPSAGGASSAAGAITVTLDEFTLKSSASSAKSGEITFKVQNKGTTPHELVVVQSDLAPDKLPISSGAADEKQLTIVGRTAQIKNGASASTKLNLQAGKYVLICNVPAHYGQGMAAAFTVE